MLERTSEVRSLDISAGFSQTLDSFWQRREVQAIRKKPTVSQEISFEWETAERLQHSAMELKQAVAPYAMHLSYDQRHRVFDEIDFLLDVEGWDEDDAQPARTSFVNFLKWAAETKADTWASLALDGDGNTVAAFVNEDNVITAAFLPDATVEWTSRIITDDGIDASAGISPLRSFAAASAALIGRL